MADEHVQLTLHQRLNAIRKAVTKVEKDKKIALKNGRSYKVVTHDGVTRAVRAASVEYGVIWYPLNLEVSQNQNNTVIHCDIAFVNVDDKEDRILIPSIGYGIDPGDKGPGKAMSYAVKMAILKTLDLESGEDEDEVDNPRETTTAEQKGVVEAMINGIAQQNSQAALKKWSADNLEMINSLTDHNRTQLRKAWTEKYNSFDDLPPGHVKPDLSDEPELPSDEIPEM